MTGTNAYKLSLTCYLATQLMEAISMLHRCIQGYIENGSNTDIPFLANFDHVYLTIAKKECNLLILI